MNRASGHDVVAVIPVREGSQRVAEKNFREFVDGKSLLELKVEQLKEERCADTIFVSSDSPRAKAIALRMGVEFLPRRSALCSNSIRWSDVIAGVVGDIPGVNPVVCWVHTTSPLHTEYAKPVKAFLESEPAHDSLVTVSPFQEFIVNAKGRPVNYHWGVWHDYSQNLEALYRVTGALFVARKRNILRWNYLVGISPMLFPVDRFSSVDVDSEEDFRIAAMLYAARTEVHE